MYLRVLNLTTERLQNLTFIFTVMKPLEQQFVMIVELLSIVSAANKEDQSVSREFIYYFNNSTESFESKYYENNNLLFSTDDLKQMYAYILDRVIR